MIVNFSQRAHNHNFELDACVRSLLDTDFYKLLMLQFVWKNFRNVNVTFSLINRKKSVRIADIVSEDELRKQLDYVRTLKFRKSELIWLAGNTFYGIHNIFEADFIKFLAEFHLPEYELNKLDGQYELSFGGTWIESMMWEIYALPVVNELKTRAGLAKLNEFELDILYARAKARLWTKIERLRGIPGLKFADFGTRRRHSFLWQEYVVQAMKSELPGIFVGTSNAYLAYKNDLEAIGTNAHELPMVVASLARQGRIPGISLKDSPYEVLRLWKEMYGPWLLIALPDTYGSTAFFRDAPMDIAKEFAGFRPDSKEPFAALEEGIAFFNRIGVNPREKIAIPSDGLDVDDIIAIHAAFGGRVKPGFDAKKDFFDASDFMKAGKWAHEPRIRLSMGWGTLLTNDFRDCHPRGSDEFDPISLVCKVKEVEGFPAVKLSDNYIKATGPKEEIDFYRSVFGTDGVENIPVKV